MSLLLLHRHEATAAVADDTTHTIITVLQLLTDSGVARICCQEGQSQKVGHRQGCSQREGQGVWPPIVD